MFDRGVWVYSMQNQEKEQNKKCKSLSLWLAQQDKAKPFQILTQSSIEQKW